jgi:hypothetical protein
MTPPMYIYRIMHRPGSRARALINGVPVYDRIVKNNVSPAQPITHWLASGDNTLTFEMAPAPLSPLTPYMGPHFEFWIQDDKDQDNKLFLWKYPTSLEDKQLPTQLPLVQSEVFHVSADLPEPAYMKATKEDFPVEGTPAMRAAVYELYDAFASKDGARYDQVMDVKYSEFDRYYTLPSTTKAEAIEQMNAPWDLEPFDEQDLRFDRYLDGRLVWVRRESGRLAVRAVNRDEPYLGWGTDFFITRLDGRWRIYW